VTYAIRTGNNGGEIIADRQAQSKMKRMPYNNRKVTLS
jgi:hypothetical protein